jgi:hypothetical protein
MSVFLKLSKGSLSLAALLIAVVAFSPSTCRAQGFPPITDEELKMTSESQAPGAPAIILFREVDRDDNGHTSHEDNYIRIKVFTEEGRRHGNVEIIFNKASEGVVNIHGRTIKPDGSAVEFDGKVYEKVIEKAQGLKYLAKTFTLPNVEIGSIIEYRYTYDLSEHYIYDSHWILSDDLFTRYARFSLKPYTSQYSIVNLRWTWQGLPPGAQPKEGADRILRMEVHNMPAFHVEDYMPPPNELKSRVDFIYEDEYLDREPDQFWKHVGKKRNEALESFIGKRKAMEEAVSQIVSPTDRRKQSCGRFMTACKQSAIPATRSAKARRRRSERKKSPPKTWRKSGSAVTATEIS